MSGKSKISWRPETLYSLLCENPDKQTCARKSFDSYGETMFVGLGKTNYDHLCWNINNDMNNVNLMVIVG